MRMARWLTFGALALAVTACNDDPVNSQPPGEPPPPTQGIQAFLQVDNDHAAPGDVIHVAVKVQLGTSSDAKLGSYTGRLTFDPAALAHQTDVQINDGLRVTNPNGAPTGLVRFAGAAAGGFSDLTLYEGVFQVKRSDYLKQLALGMDELSAASTLTNLKPQLSVAPEVFLSRSAK